MDCSPWQGPLDSAYDASECAVGGRGSAKTCAQCRFSAWLVGGGQDFWCFHPLKKPADSHAWPIPSRSHVCDLFVISSQRPSRSS